jgi:hypothetical protein
MIIDQVREQFFMFCYSVPKFNFCNLCVGRDHQKARSRRPLLVCLTYVTITRAVLHIMLFVASSRHDGNHTTCWNRTESGIDTAQPLVHRHTGCVMMVRTQWRVQHEY